MHSFWPAESPFFKKNDKYRNIVASIVISVLKRCCQTDVLCKCTYFWLDVVTFDQQKKKNDSLYLDLLTYQLFMDFYCCIWILSPKIMTETCKNQQKEWYSTVCELSCLVGRRCSYFKVQQYWNIELKMWHFVMVKTYARIHTIHNSCNPTFLLGTSKWNIRMFTSKN